MDLITLVIVVIILISSVLGFIFGNMYPVLQSFFSDTDDKEEEWKMESGQPDETENELDMPVVDTLIEKEPYIEIIVAERETEYKELVEVARIFRDTQNFKLHAEMDGKLVKGVGDLDLVQSNAFSKMVEELGAWLDEESSTSQRSTEEKIEINLEPLNADAQLPKKPSIQLAPEEDDTVVKTVSMNPLEAIMGAMQGGDKPELKSRDIAEEIDNILQKNISGTALAGRGLGIGKAVDGSLAFIVGEAIYAFMDEIEDVSVVNAFQQAIKEWETS